MPAWMGCFWLTCCFRIFNEWNETKAGTESQRDAYVADGQVDDDAVEQPELKGQAVDSFHKQLYPTAASK